MEHSYNTPSRQDSRAIMRRRFLRLLLFAVVAMLASLVLNEVAFRLQDSPVRSTGSNAIWLRHSWIDSGHSEQDYQSLVDRLHRLRISDVYFHAGPLDSKGTVSQAKFDGTENFIRHIKKLDPKIRLQPWLGQVAEFGGGGPLDLRSVQIRGAIVRTADRFLALGADGIHIDIETIYSGDRDFLQMLGRLHTLTKSHKAVLSVAACKPEEVAGLGKAVGVVARNPGYWTRGYFLEVAKEVDQVAVMAYDSGILLPGLYGRTVAWDVKWAMNNGVKNLYIGVPTYEAGGPAHFVWVENLDVALHGLRLGISGLDQEQRKKVGAAIFAEWTTSPSEERTFQKDWLGTRR